MSRDATLDGLRALRRDLGTLLIHWTRRRVVPVPQPDGQVRAELRSASDVLRTILGEGALRGGTGYIKGGAPCVCFTEAPIAEAVAAFRLGIVKSGESLRYEPYGVAVPKEWLFQQGGRPVIYGPERERAALPPELWWRHCRYEPPSVDFTWEREWRIAVQRLSLDPKKTIVIVPTRLEAFDITYSHAEMVATDWDEEGSAIAGAHEPKWLAVSLDLLGMEVQEVTPEPA